jgi:hypothetical protein
MNSNRRFINDFEFKKGNQIKMPIAITAIGIL